MTDRQKELARHALGLDGKRNRSYRNRFSAAAGTDAYDQWAAMSEAGEADEDKSGVGGIVRFRLTTEGAALALLPGETLDPEDFPAGAIDASGLPICREASS